MLICSFYAQNMDDEENTDFINEEGLLPHSLVEVTIHEESDNVRFQQFSQIFGLILICSFYAQDMDDEENTGLIREEENQMLPSNEM